MKWTKADISEELEHQRMMAAAVRRRLRILELQMAQQGMATPPQVMTEIASMTEQITRHENEIARLETLAAEDELSLAEAEYRMMLAEALNANKDGWLPLTTMTRLEFYRLKLGIKPERASELEREVREKLAEESLARLDPDIGKWLYPHTIDPYGKVLSYSVDKDALIAIGRAVRWSPSKALSLLLRVLPENIMIEFKDFRESLLHLNKVWSYQEDFILFDSFIKQLEMTILHRFQSTGTST